MQPFRNLYPVVFLAAVLCLVFTSGCSLILTVSGAISDSGSTDSVAVSAWRIDSLSPDTEVTVLLNDGTKYSNATVALQWDSLTTYQKRFEDFTRTHDVPVAYPRLGDSVFLTLRNGIAYPARLLAYDYGTFFVKPDTLRPLHLRYHTIRFLDFGEKKVTGDELWDSVCKYGVPLQAMVAVNDKATTRSFSVSPADIQSIHYKSSSKLWLTGLLVGVAVDATIIVLATTSSGKKTSTVRTGQGSCPFVYSYDGSEYVLDSETFSGAIFKSLQRTDYDNLEHLAEMDGTCRLRISNQLSEIQYVDRLGVLVIDHPSTVEILPRSPGGFSTISDLRQPFVATDFDERVVTPLVAEKDSLMWISNPAGMYSADGSSMRDGMVLRFKRPAAVQHAKLVLRLQNTAWALEMEERLLRLQGSDLQRWYDAMNNDSGLWEGFVSAVEREAMLLVQMWDGQIWKTIDHVPFVGPFVEKSHLVEADLEGTPTEELRVRIESTAGLWMVNSVQADFSADAPVQVSKAILTSAIDKRGREASQRLSATDGDYYVLNNGDEAELTFSLPEKRGASARTFVLLSTGYYIMDVPPVGTPRRDLVGWLGKEPGAFGKYSTSLFNAWLENTLATRESHP